MEIIFICLFFIIGAFLIVTAKIFKLPLMAVFGGGVLIVVGVTLLSNGADVEYGFNQTLSNTGFTFLIQETFLGTSLDGGNGDSDRNLTLDNSVLSGIESVWIDNQVLARNVDYIPTHNAANSTIKFLNPVYNTSSGLVNYYTQ